MLSRPPPRTAYLVCATPRSGSTLLCETLRTAGVAGVPLEHFEVLRHSSRPRQPREYFHGASDVSVVEPLPPLHPPRQDPEPSADWWARILRDGTSPNGVWGGKLMWSHVADLLDRVRELGGLVNADLDTALRRLLGDDLLLVHVSRPDKVAQAVSLWRAVQTHAWRAGHEPPGHQAQYSYSAIDHLVGQLEEQDAAWRAWFAATARRPLELSYDALAGDAAGAVGRILRALGVPSDRVPAPATSRQGDARSKAWAARYRAEHAARV
jgi:LPS sulfotransferase NodH